jgi:hypothetical protein
MEPVSLIVGALAAGAVAGTTAIADEAVRDSYKGLKILVQRKLAGNGDAELVLAKHEQKPEVWKEPLKAELIEAAADQDQEIIKAAEKLITLVNNQIGSQTIDNRSGGVYLGTGQVHITGDVVGHNQEKFGK